MASLPEPSPSDLDQYAGDQLIVACGMILSIATTLLVLRFYVRTYLAASKGWDDYLLFPSWALLLGLVIIYIVSVTKAGAGRRVVVVQKEHPDQLVTLSKIIYLNDWFYVLSTGLSRVSVLFLYLRVLTNRVTRILCWVTMVFLVLHTISFIIAANLECRPLAFLWDKTLPGGGVCFDVLAWWKMINFPNLVVDFAIMLIPVRTIWKLQASTSRKVGIYLVFLTGSVGTIVTVIRTILFFTLNLEGDLTWHAVPTFTLAILETGMYFAAACLIGLRPLLSKLPQWAKIRVLTTKKTSRFPMYGFSAHRRTFRGTTNQVSWQGDTLRAPGTLDSLTNIVNIDADPEMGSLETHDTNTPSADDPGQIRVKTTIDVEYKKREGNYTKFDSSS